MGINRSSLLLLLTLFLSACSSPFQSPVSTIDDTPRFLDSDRTHRVNEGETLYVIAWIYDLDFMHVASVNGLTPPYVIYPGQVLNVDPRALVIRGSGQTARVAQGNTRSSSRPDNPVQTTGIDTGNARVQSTPPSVTQQTASPSWEWPAQGNIIGRFSTSGVENKGIDIAGREGDRVVAAADGEVVYAGSGLLRYGDLVIIKHNDRFLSAYAHNSALFVSEGDKVSRGQKIAELGSTGIDRDMLHFEIRLEGQPVDPLSYLPPKS